MCVSLSMNDGGELALDYLDTVTKRSGNIIATTAQDFGLRQRHIQRLGRVATGQMHVAMQCLDNAIVQQSVC